jgi:HD-GYP domain-containing protein (c-di-GMP phosphodiesterase class II)/ribonuclease BN (tRNA processing enzyme)
MKKKYEVLQSDKLLEMIFSSFIELSAAKEYDEVIHILADMGKKLTAADRCSIWIISDDKQKLVTKVAHDVEKLEIPIDSGIVGSSITKNETIIINDVYKDSRFNATIDKQTGYKTENMLVVPMQDNNGTTIGAIQVINNKDKGAFDRRDIDRLILTSTYAAETIISIKLQQEICDTQKEIIFIMGAIGESRSKETANHVKRVAEYSKLLALAYGMDEQEAEKLKYASPMHDIGKIGIPDNILNKPSYLNQYERKIMDSHTELGYEMVKNSQRPLLKAAAIVAYEHHEKWDGSGYPRGLKGEDIHIYGRITALADVFDALGSDRVYKKAWSDEKIFAFIKEERGKHFDPKLVDLFFTNKEKIFAIRQKLKDNFELIDDKLKFQHSVKVLGAYGTKASGYGTSSIAFNKESVMDAGNLLDALGDASVDIEHIWLTHSHLDHIVDIAYILDNYFTKRKKTLYIHGLPETIKAVKENFLNDTIWPDFAKIKLQDSEKMAVEYKEVEIGKKYKIGENEFLKAFETDHTVESCGYIYYKENRKLMIATDTYSLDNIIDILERERDIYALVIECSFASSMENLAKESKHLTPKLLFGGLKKLKRDDIKYYINHIKPIYIDKITNEIEQYRGDLEVKIVKDEDFIHF